MWRTDGSKGGDYILTESILKYRNAWAIFKKKATNPTEKKIIECLEDLQHQIDETRELLKRYTEDDNK